MKDFDFNRLVYRKPFGSQGLRKIKTVIGLDTETYKDGKCFMIAFSDGHIAKVKDVPGVFFKRKYRNKNFVVYNLKFDSGSLLQFLSYEKLRELWEKGKVKYGEYIIRYIPHKLLKFSRGKNAVKIWDIQSFYSTSLDVASQKYLNDRKIDLGTRTFTRNFVEKNYDKIKEYCIKDAKLTKKLGDKLLIYIRKFKVSPTNLYSIASVAAQLFQKKCGIQDVWYFWKYYKDCLKYACNAYRGGKFEITARGSFEGYKYDIKSAYPYELSQLVSLKCVTVAYDKEVRENADYGFINAIIEINEDIPHPVGIKEDNYSFYPIGKFMSFITLDEYKYLISKNVKVEVIDGYYIYCWDKRKIYKDIVEILYNIKEEYKVKDELMSKLAKLMLNSMYGKFVQLTENENDELIAGSCWNIIYGATITARVRLRVCEIQAQLGRSCLAVHTDSVITTKKLDKKLVGNEIGKFYLEQKGEGLLILCGIYEIANHTATRCYSVNKDFSWREYLKKFPECDKIPLTEQKVIDWIEAVFRGKPELTNVFQRIPKYLDLNREYKRVWLEKTNTNKLLDKLEYSVPRWEYQGW